MNGEEIDGWLWSTSDLGVLVALDIHGDNIRFVPRGDMPTISYRLKDPLANSRPTRVSTRTLSNGLPMESNAHSSVSTTTAYEGSLEPFGTNGSSLSGDTTKRKRRSQFAILTSKLLDEVARTGLDEVLVEHGPLLRKTTRRDTLPFVDGLVLSTNELDALFDLARGRPPLKAGDVSESLLKRLPATTLVRLTTGSEQEPPQAQLRLGKRAIPVGAR